MARRAAARSMLSRFQSFAARQKVDGLSVE